MIPDLATDTLKAHGVMGLLVLISWAVTLYFYKVIERLRTEDRANLVAAAAKIVELNTAHTLQVDALREECKQESISLYSTLVEVHKNRSEQHGDLVERISDLVKNLRGTYIRRK